MDNFWLNMKSFRSALIICLSVSLAACANLPQTLGVSAEHWDDLPAHERREMIVHYNIYRQTNRTNLWQNTPQPGATGVEIHLISGSARMWPYKKRYGFKPAKLWVVEAHCASVPLLALDGQHQTNFEVCYFGGRLSLDPIRTDPQYFRGTVSLHRSPLWDLGMDYSLVSSCGYASLKDTNLIVKETHE